jgi:murein DD-endopeptidase MepM/ murein hydrolase activator NlpD
VEQSVVDEKTETQEGLQVYRRIARFSKAPGRVVVQWTLGPDGSVQAFFIRPLPEEPTPQQLDYTTKTELHLPFSGAWFVVWGGRSVAQNYHFATVDQRFAYDLLVQRDGSTHAGAGQRNEDYYCFDQKIVAPAAGTVVAVENGIADNVPGVMNAQAPLGNHVILDHGNGEFSFLCHFHRGTVAVKKGDGVKAGDLLGRCGNSGHSSEPHLHYHLQDSGEFGAGHGLPAPFKSYRADGKPVDRGEPVKGQTIESR